MPKKNTKRTARNTSRPLHGEVRLTPQLKAMLRVWKLHESDKEAAMRRLDFELAALHIKNKRVIADKICHALSQPNGTR